MQTTHIAATPARGLIDKARRLAEDIAQPWLVPFALRVALAVPFWKSGLLKWDGFLQLKDTAIYLFADEFKLHLPGGPYPFPAPAVVAFASGCGEVLLPVLLVLGLGARLAALGLSAVNVMAVLSLPDMPDAAFQLHVFWGSLLAGLVLWGPGRWSVDGSRPTSARVQD